MQSSIELFICLACAKTLASVAHECVPLNTTQKLSQTLAFCMTKARSADGTLAGSDVSRLKRLSAWYEQASTINNFSNRGTKSSWSSGIHSSNTPTRSCSASKKQLLISTVASLCSNPCISLNEGE